MKITKSSQYRISIWLDAGAPALLSICWLEACTFSWRREGGHRLARSASVRTPAVAASGIARFLRQINQNGATTRPASHDYAPTDARRRQTGGNDIFTGMTESLKSARFRNAIAQIWPR